MTKAPPELGSIDKVSMGKIAPESGLKDAAGIRYVGVRTARQWYLAKRRIELKNKRHVAEHPEECMAIGTDGDKDVLMSFECIADEHALRAEILKAGLASFGTLADDQAIEAVELHGVDAEVAVAVMEMQSLTGRERFLRKGASNRRSTRGNK